ncbi:MAG TPA: sigma-54 dependent transcriptional regulator [Deltaproteobacteria bacterium]|nr:sigma-54 dependent transcriptional regulator [Deltaproteobacteria bacterium]
MIDSAYPSYGILIVDDEEAWLRSISMTLAMSGGINNVVRCSDSRQVMGILSGGVVGLVLLDLNMPHVSGEELIAGIVEQYPQIPVIVISGLNQVDTAVSCMKQGAFDFFVKTVDEERLIQGVQRAIRMIDLQRENHEMRARVLNARLRSPDSFADIITADRSMISIFSYIEAVAKSTQPILITGESGTGKELIARAIHRIGGRSGKLVAVNVSGLDDSMFSDTLFGHTRGAFTGADTARGGMIEQAAGGTLFLDEIGDLGNASQVKLLRLLQEGEYYPVGSDVSRRMNAGVVVATHQDLAACISSGQFRKDLYYRLCSHHVHIPPLRERRDDIPLLLDHFLGEAAEKLNRKRPAIPRELPVLLKNYDFPGNVRELRSLVFDAVSRHQAHILSMDTFRAVIARRYGAPVPAAESAAGQNRSVFIASEPLPRLHDVAGLLVSEAMRRAEGNQSIASRLIGVSQPALSKRLRKMEREQEPITVERL